MTSAVKQAALERYNKFLEQAVSYQHSEGMSQEAMAEYCEIGITTWQNIIYKKSKTGAYVFLKISTATGIAI
jgi:hypothetical protein